MEAKNGDDYDERTFRVNFSDDGATKLADLLTDTLKDYMGDDFVDDTLVKYVIVLLGNGRRKEEVKEDLDVFLGDKSDSFATWLWDHLASNLHQYVEAPWPSPNGVAKANSELAEHTSKDESKPPVSETDRVNSSKISGSRLKRDWKGLVTGGHQPPLRSSIVTHILNEEIGSRQSVSPEHPVHRKRNRQDEHPEPKKDLSQPNVAASRRLLQFAVRDAVATSRPSNSVSELARKRLRSVVSASIGRSREEDNHRRKQSVAWMPNPLATAIRAVAEASRDVRRRSSKNVFDRLSRGDASSDQVSVFKEPAVKDDEYDDYDHDHEKAHQNYLQTRTNTRHYNVNAAMMDSSSALASDSASDNEVCDDVNARKTDVSETVTSAKADESLMVGYSVAQNTDEMKRQSRKKDQDLSVSMANTKHKIVNISVNVNTWKPPHYQSARQMPEIETPKSTQEAEMGTYSNIRVMKENSNSVTVFGNLQTPRKKFRELWCLLLLGHTRWVIHWKMWMHAQYLSIMFILLLLRTLYLGILTNLGKCSRSAYVEFMRKEAANNSLTLDGTSFMSRIIKVVKKSSVQLESNSMIWPRISRGSPFGVARFAQAPFPRVFPGAYRARPPIKLGMRSMQWTRDTQPTSTESVTSVPGNKINAAGRGLTYIRPNAKEDGSTGGV